MNEDSGGGESNLLVGGLLEVYRSEYGCGLSDQVGPEETLTRDLFRAAYVAMVDGRTADFTEGLVDFMERRTAGWDSVQYKVAIRKVALRIMCLDPDITYALAGDLPG